MRPIDSTRPALPTLASLILKHDFVVDFIMFKSANMSDRLPCSHSGPFSLPPLSSNPFLFAKRFILILRVAGISSIFIHRPGRTVPLPYKHSRGEGDFV